MERWAVIGGGMLGMTLALRLVQAGRRVTLIESAAGPGGLAAAWRIGGVTWDKHYHVTLLSDSRLRSLLGELGLDDEIVWTQTRTGFYSGGQHHSMSSSLDFLLFPPLGLVDKFRLGLTIFAASRTRDWQRLENILVEDWLVSWSGRRTFEKMWKPLLISKLGDGYRRTSAAFIWATIQRLYAARRSGMKREMFGYVPGGYARILDCFTARLRSLGVDMQTGVKVLGLQGSGGRVRITTSTGGEEFDRAVSTVPGLGTPSNVTYQGIVCASLLLREPLTPYYVTNITDPGLPFTGVIDMSALVDRAHFGGNALVYLPKYVAPDDPLFGEPDTGIEASFLDGLAAMYPKFRREDVLAFRVSRVRHVFPVPVPGYSCLVQPFATATPGLFCVNSSHIVNGTLNVNETVTLAERALPGLLSVPTAAPLEATV
ncbi:MAG: NAD(P)/FAD-dependent oxidoreductase [Acidobacteria bacterium]|nr:NAD(P)/FAD-dependent oxidoreductase [Acidobacteriota bacterium]